MSFSDKLGSFGLKAAHVLGVSLGPTNNVRLGKKLGSLVCYFTPRELKVVEAQLQFASRAAPELKRLQAKELLCAVYSHVGESVAELSHFNYLLELDENNSFKRIEIDGNDECLEVKNSGDGALFLSGHIGNFELLAAYHIRNGISLSILGREPNYPFLSTWIQDVRTDYGGESLLRGGEGEGKRTSAVASIKALKTGKVLALLPDQDTALGSEYAPFFGLPAAHVVAPIKLAMKSEKKIYTSFIVRTGELRHKVFCQRVDYNPKSENPEKDVLEIYSQRFQKLVTKYPEQYLWIHRRWRRRPGLEYDKNPSALRSHKDYLQWLLGHPT
jgi:KDO2-lipid IV(A) lauroyltransferase